MAPSWISGCAQARECGERDGRSEGELPGESFEFAFDDGTCRFRLAGESFEFAFGDGTCRFRLAGEILRIRLRRRTTPFWGRAPGRWRGAIPARIRS